MLASDVGDRDASNIISRRWDPFRRFVFFRRCRRRHRHDFHWFTDCHLEAIFNMNASRESQSSSTVDGKDVRRLHQRFSLNPAQHDILPHRQSQLSDLTIRLHITTSLKSITETVTLSPNIQTVNKLQTMSRDH